MSANLYGIIAVTGRAHCQRQVAFYYYYYVFSHFVMHHGKERD